LNYSFVSLRAFILRSFVVSNPHLLLDVCPNGANRSQANALGRPESPRNKSARCNARSDTKVTASANQNATLTILTDAHGSILADTLLRDRRGGAECRKIFVEQRRVLLKYLE
jgi:hypothetical protein